jgi:DNA polymerase I-like protein with 3'-5' exonuclease and polymerase domains
MWKCKEQYPSLKNANIIGLDLETYDPNLMEKGPGAIRNDGYIVGFSIATDDGFSDYYPVRHNGGNVEDVEKTIRWLREQLSYTQPKVGANILYDLIWLKKAWNIDVAGLKYDVQTAEPLINENRQTYKLGVLSEIYLGESKEELGLLDAGLNILGINKTATMTNEDVITKVKGRLNEIHSSYVGEYGEKDALLPISIFKLQEQNLRWQGLWDLFIMETELLDVLLAMWLRGVPIDYDKGEKACQFLSEAYDNCMSAIKFRAGFEPNIWAAEDLSKVCNNLGIEYKKTPKGAPSFESEWLESHDNDVMQMILKARQLNRGGSVFIKSKILDCSINGRIHPQFWPVKTDRGGTVSGRFACSNPNMQQVPARNPEISPIVRGVFVPEPGCKWMVADYSQQEPRVTIHYASLLKLKGSEKAMNQYINNPRTDYHQMTADIAKIKRKEAKTLNLGLAYGMGKAKLAEKLNKPYSEAMDIYNQYHEALPYIKELGDYVQRAATSRGEIKTLLGRKRHFNLFGPAKWSEGIIALPQEEAILKYGAPVQRYYLHKALNSLIQGGSADMVKKAMIDCHKAGYTPYLTIHDELDFCNITTVKQVIDIREIMVNAIKLTVPLVVDIELGDDWGDCQEIEDHMLQYYLD